jgi:parallel beta-helix repeat protein
MSAQSPYYKLSKKVSALALIAFSCAAVCQAATVNIHPGQDIPTVVALSPAGTTFVIYPGTYRLTRHIVPKTGDSFIGQTACAPPRTSCPAILTGSRIIGPLARLNGNNYEVTGQTQQGRITFTNYLCQPGYLSCNLPEDLFFDGVPYQHLYASSLPSIGAKQWWFDYANNIIYFHDNPAGHVVETSVLDTAFLSTANNVTFQYLTVKGFASPLTRAAIEPTDGNAKPTYSLNWVVKNCELYNNHGAGVRLAFGLQVYNSYLHDNGALGITGGTVSPAPSGIVIQGNTITHNNYAKVLSGVGAGGFKVGYTANLVLRGNTISNNDGTGVHFDATSASPIVDGNVITENAGGAGIGYEISVNSALFRNNIVLRNAIPDAVPGNAAGIGSYASIGVTMYCNVLEVPNNKGANAMMVVGSNRGFNFAPPYEYLMSKGNSFHHNTVIWDPGSAGAVGYLLFDALHQPNFFLDNTPPDYNTYHLPSLSAANFIYDNNPLQKNTRKTFTQYQASGADIHGSADTNYTSGFPTVAITSPADQSSFTNSVAVQATAADKSGINRVEFYVDWKLQTTVAGPPYSFNWTNGTTGAHTVAAMAYSNAGIRNCFAVTLKKQ